MSLLCMLAALAYSLVSLFQYMEGAVIPGWTSLIISSAAASGAVVRSPSPRRVYRQDFHGSAASAPLYCGENIVTGFVPTWEDLRRFVQSLLARRWIRFGLMGGLATLCYALLGLLFVNVWALPCWRATAWPI